MFLVPKVKAYLPKFHKGVEITDKYPFITVNKMESTETVGSTPESGDPRDMWIRPGSQTPLVCGGA